MKVATSGASGFVGTHLNKYLEKRGDLVFSIPRKIYYDYSELKRELENFNPDYIFHLAAYGNMAHQTDPLEMIYANIEGTYNLLDASLGTPYKALINVSTSSVMLPHETFYSATKAGAERICKAFADNHDKPVVNVRPYSLYGIGEAYYRFIPTVFNSCLTGKPMNLDPLAVHDWLYIDDFIEHIVSLADNALIENLQGQTITSATGIPTKNRKVVELIEKITGKKAVIAEEKSLRIYDNTEWVSNRLNLDSTPLELGLKLIYDDILENRKRGDKHMAYDVTSLTQAIAEGRVDENAARDLINRFRDLEIETARLLTPTQEQPAQETPAESQAQETPVEQPAQDEAPAEQPAQDVPVEQPQQEQELTVEQSTEEQPAQ